MSSGSRFEKISQSVGCEIQSWNLSCNCCPNGIQILRSKTRHIFITQKKKSVILHFLFPIARIQIIRAARLRDHSFYLISHQHCAHRSRVRARLCNRDYAGECAAYFARGSRGSLISRGSTSTADTYVLPIANILARTRRGRSRVSQLTRPFSRDSNSHCRACIPAGSPRTDAIRISSQRMR